VKNNHFAYVCEGDSDGAIKSRLCGAFDKYYSSQTQGFRKFQCSQRIDPDFKMLDVCSRLFFFALCCLIFVVSGVEEHERIFPDVVEDEDYGEDTMPTQSPSG